MKTATELRNTLAEVFEDLRAGDLEYKNAAELANLAGKMISSAKVQIEYYSMRGDMPQIKFLEEPKGRR